MRSKGQVKFIKLSSRVQITAAAVVASVLLVWLAAMLVMAISQFAITSERNALNRKQAAVATSASRVAAYRKSVDDVAADLAKRQDLLETIVTANLGEAALSGDAAQDDKDANDVVGEAEKTARKISAMIPEAEQLANIEARQIAFADMLTRAANARAEKAASAIVKFGLNPSSVAKASDSKAAQGGPLIPISFGSAVGNDGFAPRFDALGKALARMDALERGLARIPSGKPAGLSRITSGFGYRHDPFNGSGAMHSGIDFKGTTGQAILAAAQGKVVFAGRKSGYGNCVEVAHGNGLVTRYAHLSSIGVRMGQKVAKGERIAGMGSTGRSTGTHLHFEVRLNGRAINPRPFLEANRDVLKIQAVATQRTVDADS